MRSVTEHADVTALFIVGSTDIQVPTCGGDTLYVPCTDDYAHLPQKTFWMAHWAEQQGFDFLFKCDDDTFVHISRLMAVCKESKGLDYRGRMLARRYASGGAGYLLSSPSIMYIASARHLSTATGAEDVLVGEHLAQCNVRLFDDHRFEPWGNSVPDVWNDRVTGHYVHPSDMTARYKSMLFPPSVNFKILDAKVSYGTLGLNGYRGFNIGGETAVQLSSDWRGNRQDLISAHASSWIDIRTFVPVTVTGLLDLAAQGCRTPVELIVDGKALGCLSEAGAVSASITIAQGYHKLEARAILENGHRYIVWSVKAHFLR
jgi:hypothetical protein